MKVEIQVVLEYQWMSTRDLISNVQALQIIPYSAESQTKDGPAEDHSATIMHEVSLKSIIESLSLKGFDLEPEHRISFKDPAKSLYVYIGKAADQAVIDTCTVPASAFSSGSDSPVLTLLIREVGSGLSGQKLPSTSIAVADVDCRKKLFDIAENGEADNHQQDLASTTAYAKQTHQLLASQSLEPVRVDHNGSASKASKGSPMAGAASGLAKSGSFMDAADLKRTKERQIRFVVERVSLWRKLYNGVELGNGETVRYSLEDSARLVGISKKSLDDYLLQLRFGRMYGFDFLKH